MNCKNIMKTSVSTRTGLSRTWFWGLVLAAWLPMAAQADEYAEVSKLINARQYKEALTKADQHLSSKPRDPQMRFIRGVILSETGRTADAITVFTRITEDFPELPEPYNNLAVLHAAQNQFDKARSALEMAIRTNPSYATAHENLGDIYARLASQAYSKALQLDAGNTAVQPKLALIRTLFNADPKGQRAPVAAQAPAPAAPAPAAPAPAPVQVAQAPAPAAAPVATPSPAPAAPPVVVQVAAAQTEVEAAVRRWAAAWADKDMGGYLQSYASEFAVPGNRSRQAWEQERRDRIVGKTRISVELSDVVITVNGNRATARFRQNYSADALNINSRKTLEMVLSGNRWLIVRETAN